MPRVLLFRHAKASRAGSGLKDRDRPLAKRGIADAPVMGDYLARHGLVPDLVLCSPALRTRDTWRLAAGSFTQAFRMQEDDRLYEADARDLLDVVRGVADEVGTLLIVGHNPGLEDLADLLVGSGDAEARAAMRAKFPTGAIAVIDFVVPHWADVKPGAGRLDRFVSPKILAAEAD